MIKELKQVTVYAYAMWNNLATHSERVVKDINRESKVNRQLDEESLRWNENVEILKPTQYHLKFGNTVRMRKTEKSTRCKRRSKEGCLWGKTWSLGNFYIKLDKKEREEEFCRFARLREENHRFKQHNVYQRRRQLLKVLLKDNENQ